MRVDFRRLAAALNQRMGIESEQHFIGSQPRQSRILFEISQQSLGASLIAERLQLEWIAMCLAGQICPCHGPIDHTGRRLARLQRVGRYPRRLRGCMGLRQFGSARNRMRNGAAAGTKATEGGFSRICVKAFRDKSPCAEEKTELRFGPVPTCKLQSSNAHERRPAAGRV